MNGEQKPPGVSLRWIAVCCGAAIAFAVGGLIFLRAEHQIQAKETADLLRTIAAYKAAQLAAWVEDLKSDALEIQNASVVTEPLAHYLAGDEMAPPKPLGDLLRYLVVSRGVDDVVLVDRAGRVRFSLSREDKLHSEGLKALREALQTGEPVMTNMHFDPRTETRCVGIAVPIVGRGDSSTQPSGGLLLVSMGSRLLDPLAQAWPVPSATGEVLLVRREGDAVVFLNAPRQPDAALRLRLPPSRQDLVEAMAVRGQSDVVHGTDYRGMPVIAAITAVKGTPWFLIAKMDRREAEAKSRKMSISIIIHVLSFGVLLVGLIFWARQSARKAHFKKLYHAESELRRSLARQSVVLQALGEAVIATDAQGRVDVWNPEAERLTEWPAQEVRGKPLAQVLTVLDERKNHVDEGLWGLARQRQHTRGNKAIFVKTRSGRNVPVALRVSTLEDASDGLSAYILCLRNQSQVWLARKIQEIRLDFMERSERQDVGHILPQTLQAVADLLDSSEGFYAVLGSNGSTVECVHCSESVPMKFCHGLCSQGHHALEKAPLWADAARTTETMIVNNYVDLRPDGGLPEGHGPVHRLLVVPVVRDGVTRALFALVNKTSDYTESDAEAVETVASMIHQVVEQRQADERLRQSEARYRRLFQEHKAVKLLIDPLDGRIVDANRAAVAFYGWSYEELTHMFIHQINTLPPDVAKERMAKVLKERRTYVEFQHRCADGSVRDVEVYSSCVDMDEKPYLHSIIFDVTEKKKMEAERTRWLTAIEQAGDVMFITDVEGIIQ